MKMLCITYNMISHSLRPMARNTGVQLANWFLLIKKRPSVNQLTKVITTPSMYLRAKLPQWGPYQKNWKACREIVTPYKIISDTIQPPQKLWCFNDSRKPTVTSLLVSLVQNEPSSTILRWTKTSLQQSDHTNWTALFRTSASLKTSTASSPSRRPSHPTRKPSSSTIFKVMFQLSDRSNATTPWNVSVNRSVPWP